MPHPSSPHHRPRPDRQEGVQVTAKTLNWKSGDTSSSAALLLSVWLWASHLNLAGLHFFSCKIEFGADIWFPWFLSVLRMMSLWFQLWVYGSMSRVLLYWQWFKELLRKTRQGTPSKVWDGQGQTTRPSPVQSEAVHGPGPEPLTDCHISSHRSHCSEMLFRGTADSWSAFCSSSVTCEAKSEVLSYHGALFKGNNPLKKGDVCVGGVGIRWEEHSVSLQGSWVQTVGSLGQLRMGAESGWKLPWTQGRNNPAQGASSVKAGGADPERWIQLVWAEVQGQDWPGFSQRRRTGPWGVLRNTRVEVIISVNRWKGWGLQTEAEAWTAGWGAEAWWRRHAGHFLPHLCLHGCPCHLLPPFECLSSCFFLSFSWS